MYVKGQAIVLLITALTILAAAENKPCLPKDFGRGSVVCVCNDDHCDTLEPLSTIPSNKFYHLVSSKAGKRFSVSHGNTQFEIKDTPDVIVSLNRNRRRQKIIGFGGAFTDSATINIKGLSDKLQHHVLESYFGSTGLEYNIGRVNMAGCDFSTRLYSYDDFPGDMKLERFALTNEDVHFKIPCIKKALALNPQISLFASPWSAPPWMKTNNNYTGPGVLRPDCYQPWANYFVKFLEEYRKHGITFWAVTAQNEPITGLVPNFPINSMGWNAEEQRDFIKNNLGPAIASSGNEETKIIIFDEQRALINAWANTVLSDPGAAKYISGIGVHWYFDPFFPASFLTATHLQYPDYFILGTEACNGLQVFTDKPVILGSWERGESYAADTMEDLNHRVSGWTDYNLVVDMQGGPSWGRNFVDAPIIADNFTNQIYKNPMFYCLGHFSKFFSKDSVIIDTFSVDLKGVGILAGQRPDGMVVAAILNKDNAPKTIALEDNGKYIQLQIDARSMNTIVYAP